MNPHGFSFSVGGTVRSYFNISLKQLVLPAKCKRNYYFCYCYLLMHLSRKIISIVKTNQFYWYFYVKVKRLYQSNFPPLINYDKKWGPVTVQPDEHCNFPFTSLTTQ